jgi:hypothetical protein
LLKFSFSCNSLILCSSWEGDPSLPRRRRQHVGSIPLPPLLLRFFINLLMIIALLGDDESGGGGSTM